MEFIKINDFAKIEAEFIERAHDAAWCSAATINRGDRPRSRVLHPIWQGKTGWVASNPNSLKAKHLAHNPYMSLAYIKDPLKPVYVDCRAEWVDDADEKQRIWDAFLNAPPPVGYDPAIIWSGVDDPNYSLLKLTPWRIELYSIGQVSKTWHAESEG